jgi:hypothetical protein
MSKIDDIKVQLMETQERVNRTGDQESMTVDILGYKFMTIIKPKEDFTFELPKVDGPKATPRVHRGPGDNTCTACEG